MRVRTRGRSLGAMVLWGLVAWGHAPAVFANGVTYNYIRRYRSSLPRAPRQLLLKEPCHSSRSLLQARREIILRAKRTCARLTRYTRTYAPTVVVVARTPQAKGRYCLVTLREVQRGYCYKAVQMGHGYYLGVVFGKGRGIASGVSYCRKPAIMTKLKRSARKRAKKSIQRYCSKKRFTLITSMQLREHRKLKNISRKQDTYICSASFKVVFQCEKEKLR